MKKVFLCICCLISILAGTFAPLSAAAPEDFVLGIEVDRDNYDISITGTSSSIKEGKVISLMILKPDYTAEDIEEDIENEDYEQFIENIHQVMTITAQTDGQFSFDFNMTGASGLYTVRIGGMDYEPVEETFFFYGRDYVDTLFGLVEDATDEDDEDSTELHKIISVELNRDILGLEAEHYDGGTKTSEILFKHKPYTNVADLQTKFVLSSLLAQIQDGDAQAILDEYGETLGLDETVYAGYEALDTDEKATVAADLKALKLDSADTLKTAFNEAVLMTIAKGFNNYSALDDFYEEYETALALDEDDYKKYLKLNSKSAVNKVIIKELESIDTLAELREEFSDAVSKQYKKEKDDDGGSSGSSGSSSSISVEKPITTTPVVTQPTPGVTYLYSDVDSTYWAYDAILSLTNKGIVSGVGDNLFAPNDYVTREQMVKLLIEAFNKNTGNTQSSFADVSEDAWYAMYIASAEEIGLAKGDGYNFGVGNSLTRQDAAVMAYRMLGIAGAELSGEKAEFIDDAEIADYAKEAVYAMQGAGIIKGMDDGTFSPKAPCTRAMAAKVIYELLKIAG